MNTKTNFLLKTKQMGLLSILLIMSLVNIAALPTDVNLIVVISDCTQGNNIKGAFVEVPTAAVHAGSQSSAITDQKGFARIYPLRFGGQVHEIRVTAAGYLERVYQRKMKAWSSNEAKICLTPNQQNTKVRELDIKLFSWSEKYPDPYAFTPPVFEECQCVAYWSRSEFGAGLPIGVAGLSPDLMIQLDYFSQIPKQHGTWQKQTAARPGDTIIIQPVAFMYRYNFTGNAYKNYIQARPGHIGIIESVEYLHDISIELVGKENDHFSGWHVRVRNANWPSGWMENNRYYPERVGRPGDEIVCKNVGVSDIIIPQDTPLISFWGLVEK